MRHLLGGDQAKLAGMSESAELAEPVVFSVLNSMDIQSYQVEIEQDNTNKTSPKGSEVVMNDWLFRIPVEPRQTCEIEYLVKAVELELLGSGQHGCCYPNRGN